MKIIDWTKKGNVVRFYLGKDDEKDYWGDDWNDRPYEHNAERVYDEYVEKVIDIAFPYDWHVSEPADDWHYNGNSPYSKEDFKNKKAPCVIAIPAEIWKVDEYAWDEGCYSEWVGADNIYKFYFGDGEKKITDTVESAEYEEHPVIIS